MKTSNIFKLVLTRIKAKHKKWLNPSGTNYIHEHAESIFICFDLEDLMAKGRISAFECDRCQDIIQTRMGACRYDGYEDWVKKYRPEVYAASKQKGTVDFDANVGRMAWLKSLIAEFKAKGD